GRQVPPPSLHRRRREGHLGHRGGSGVSTAARKGIEERAARYQRRYTGSWKRAQLGIGPVLIETEYRRRRRLAFATLDVALHDLWAHSLVRPARRLFRRL